MEICVIRNDELIYDYRKKETELGNNNSLNCLVPLTFEGWRVFGIDPILIKGLVGVMALVALVGMFAANEFDIKTTFSNEGKTILLTILAIILILAFITVDFHIYI